MVTAQALVEDPMILMVALVSIPTWTLSWLQQSASHCKRPTLHKLLKINLSLLPMEAERVLMQELEVPLEFNQVYKQLLKRMMACMTMSMRMSRKMMMRRPCKKLWLSP